MNQLRRNRPLALGIAGAIEAVFPELGLERLNSRTLDRTDVRLARQWLRNDRGWEDPSIIQEYEAGFARWNGSSHAFASMGGRVALSACIHALELEPGGEALLPGYTCVVVPNAFRFAGLKPVYCDIELDTYGLDAEDLEKKVTIDTRVILLHHLYGLVSRDYESILEFARERGIPVIEDCAHAAGAEYRGRKVGNRGDCAFYSTEQSKIFNTGQGGIAVTNSDRLAHRMAEFHARASFPSAERTEALLHNVLINYYERSHPAQWLTRYWARLRHGRYRLVSTTSEEERGVQPEHYGQRMPAPLASIGANQLKKLHRFNARRRKAAIRWDHWADEHGFRKPVRIPGSTPVFLRYPVLGTPEMKRDRSWGRSLGLETGVWFKTHVHPSDEPVANCPNADVAVERCVNLPTILDGDDTDGW